MRTTRSRAAGLALLAVPAIALSACGGDGATKTSTTTATTSTAAASSSAPAPSDSASSAATPAAAPTQITPAKQGEIAGVTVAGTDAKPVLTIAKPPVNVTETVVKVVKEGTGPEVKVSDVVVANALFASGKSGKTLDDTFAAGRPQQMPVKAWLTGIARAMVGQKEGARVLVEIAPQDAFGAQGQPQVGIGPNETIVSLIEIKKIGFQGQPCKTVTTKDGLPEVTLAAGKAATMKPVSTPAPTQPTMYVVKEGTGKAIEAGQTGSWQYTGMLWKDGKKFDSSYDNGGKPVDFPIGAGQVIPAWDKCLTGLKEGSQVVVVAPYADAYGEKGNPPAIPAKADLVFAVELAKVNG